MGFEFRGVVVGLLNDIVIVSVGSEDGTSICRRGSRGGLKFSGWGMTVVCSSLVE